MAQPIRRPITEDKAVLPDGIYDAVWSGEVIRINFNNLELSTKLEIFGVAEIKVEVIDEIVYLVNQ